MHKDIHLKLYKALDMVIAYVSFRFLIGTIPTQESMKHQLKINMTDGYHTEDEIDTIIDKKGKAIISNFKTVMNNLSNSYSPRVGPYISRISMYGVTIETPVPLILTNKNTKLSKTKFFIMDYSNITMTNIYGRLWATCVSEELSEKGQTNSDIGVININRTKNKAFYPISSSKSLSLRMIQNICIKIAANLISPNFSNRCAGCPYTTECAEAITL